MMSMLIKRVRCRHGLTVLLTCVPFTAFADGFVIDKVYHPYVEPLEREIEYRTLYINDSDSAADGSWQHRISLGAAFRERFFAEVYYIANDDSGEDSLPDAYELELTWQLTEQGEYFADWGLLFELEKAQSEDEYEYATTLLAAKEFGQWTATANLAAIYEWGDSIENEWESSSASQLRYRYRPGFEPAVELYTGQSTIGLGPVAVGEVRFTGRRNLRWELGLIFGVDSETPDQTIRGMLEYEF
jgi:hypothetical protein